MKQGCKRGLSLLLSFLIVFCSISFGGLFEALAINASDLTLRYPVSGYSSVYVSGSHFSSSHTGTDFGGNTDCNALAAADGVVAQTYTYSDTISYQTYGQPDGGTRIAVYHASLGIYTVYKHLDAIYVSKGQSVKAGDPIGSLGNTGYSFGVHLHFDICTSIHNYAYPDKETTVNPELCQYYFTNAPTYANLSVSGKVFNVGERITFSVKSDHATSYLLTVDRVSESGAVEQRILTQAISNGSSIDSLSVGYYSAYVTARNSAGSIDSKKVYFYVNYKQESLAASFSVQCSSKAIRELPYSSSTLKRTVTNGDTVEIKGFVYNMYGNLWYITADGYYIYENYLKAEDYDKLPPSNYCPCTMEVMCSSKTAFGAPLSTSEANETLYQGDSVHAIGYLYNVYGSLMYVLDSGSYVFGHYLKVLSSESRTPSNYLSTKMKVKASSKSIFAAPYGSSDETGQAARNTIVSVYGYVYNRYGNLWYMLDSDNYIYSSYLEQTIADSTIPSNYTYQTYVTTAEKDCCSEPYAVAGKKTTIESGQQINTIGYLINLFGNKWYECEDGNFIYNSSIVPSELTVYFDACDGICPTNNKIVTYHSTYGELPTATKTGFTFVGWFTAKNGGTQIKNTTVVSITQNQTLFAHYTPNSYTVTLDPSGGACGIPAITVYADGLYGVLPVAVREGYTFDGWFLPDGTQITEDSPVTVLADHTLTAHWTQIFVAPTIEAASTAVLDAERGFLYGLDFGVTEEALREQYLSVSGDGSLEILSDGVIGTGTIVRLINGQTGEADAEYTVVIFGDINGDGMLTSADITAIRNINARLASYDADSAYIFAADVTHDGDVNSSDVTTIRSTNARISVIDQTAAL